MTSKIYSKPPLTLDQQAELLLSRLCHSEKLFSENLTELKKHWQKQDLFQ